MSWPRSAFNNVNAWALYSVEDQAIDMPQYWPSWAQIKWKNPTERPPKSSKADCTIILDKIFWRCISLTRVDIWLQRKLKADGSRHTIICASATSKKISDQTSIIIVIIGSLNIFANIWRKKIKWIWIKSRRKQALDSIQGIGIIQLISKCSK